MDPHGERYSEHVLSRVHEQTDRLQRVPHDVLGLGVGFRLLMQHFDRWYLFATLGDQSTVGLFW
jgi:hypothetical protein